MSNLLIKNIFFEELKKQTKSGNSPINTENKPDGCQRGKGRGMGKMDDRQWETEASSCGMSKQQNKSQSIGNIVNGVIVLSDNR